MLEGQQTSQKIDAQYEPMMISEDVEEELFRLGASSDTIKKLQEFDDMVHEPMSGNLDGSIRTKALRCMFKMLQANGLAGENTWFKAALLLDRFLGLLRKNF